MTSGEAEAVTKNPVKNNERVWEYTNMIAKVISTHSAYTVKK